MCVPLKTKPRARARSPAQQLLWYQATLKQLQSVTLDGQILAKSSRFNRFNLTSIRNLVNFGGIKSTGSKLVGKLSASPNEMVQFVSGDIQQPTANWPSPVKFFHLWSLNFENMKNDPFFHSASLFYAVIQKTQLSKVKFVTSRLRRRRVRQQADLALQYGWGAQDELHWKQGLCVFLFLFLESIKVLGHFLGRGGKR